MAESVCGGDIQSVSTDHCSPWYTSHIRLADGHPVNVIATGMTLCGAQPAPARGSTHWATQRGCLFRVVVHTHQVHKMAISLFLVVSHVYSWSPMAPSGDFKDTHSKT